MTQDKKFKRLVRERMKCTGESYSTARMRILAERNDCRAEERAREIEERAREIDRLVRGSSSEKEP